MRRYPEWLLKPFSPDGIARSVHALVDDLQLTTVCESAVCPNLRDCYSQRQLTFMILGNRCTRSCMFCAVDSGRPTNEGLADEPQRVAAAVARLGLKHVVITSVARDDLRDEGAGHFARVIHAVRERNAGVTIEILVPDFHGRPELIEQVLAAEPEVFAHNIETVERLSPVIRPQATYRRSLEVLRLAARSGRRRVKSSIMLGLGERAEEVRSAMLDLRAAGCTHVTLGQYLRPTPEHVPALEYVSPQRFDDYAQDARRLGFAWVLAGPFVRSSYHAIDGVTPSEKG